MKVVHRVIALVVLIGGLIFVLIWQLGRYNQLAGLRDRFKDIDLKSLGLDSNPLLDQVTEPKGKLVRAGSDERANATILSLVRNRELGQLIGTMKEVERTFNSKFNYPWTFINDEPFSKDFIAKTQKLTNAQVRYEIIPNEDWKVPDFINEDLYQASAKKLSEENVQYSSLKSYHQMCRWNSGKFYELPALANTRWYWRVEPNTHYFCDIDYDVFKYMQDNNKTYGFVINLYDSPQSVRNLWPLTQNFLAEHPEYLHKNNALGWVTDSKRRPEHNKIANGFSTCHFWSNFEIGDMDFWRSKPYTDYFNYLDESGGFFYERWGDAPVHSLGLALFEDKNKIHWFKDIGYNHIPYFNCPNSPKCNGCEPGKFFAGVGLGPENCMQNWFKYAHQN